MIKKIINKYNKLSVQLKASFWFVVCSFLQKGIVVICTPIYTRMMTTGEYGQYSVFNSWFNILIVFVTLRLASGFYSQGIVKYKEEKEKFSSTTQGLVLSLVLFWAIIYILFNEFWNNLFKLTTVQMLSMIVLMWTTSIFEFWATEQRTSFKYKALIIVTLLVSLLKPIVSITIMYFSNDKATAKILGFVIVELSVYSLCFISQMRKGKAFFSKKYWIYALKFGIPLIPHYLSQTILNSSDRIMIERIIGVSEAGIYSLGYSLSQVMILFNTGLMGSLSPWIYQKIREKKEKDIPRIAYIAMIFVAFINIMLIALSPEIIKIFAPKEYYNAMYIIPPVAMSVFFIFLYNLFAKFEFYYEKTKMIAFSTTLSAILNIVLNYIFIKKYGFIAAGYTTLFCYVLYALLHYIMMNKVSKNYLDGINIYNTKIILLISVGFVIIGFIFLMLYHDIIIRYLLLLLLLFVILLKRKKIYELIKIIMK